MALSINPSKRAISQYPIDDRFLIWDDGAFRPYASTAEVLSTIPSGRRHKGLMVLVGEVIYWFKSGVADLDLVAFQTLTKANTSAVNLGSDDAQYITPASLNASRYLTHFKMYAEASGTDTYTATLTPAPVAYAAGLLYLVKFANANTGAATININALGAKDVIRMDGSPLEAGDIPAGALMLIGYNGTAFQVIGAMGAADETIPEYEDNTAAIADGLNVGDKYKTPLDGDRSYLCVVATPAVPDPLMLRILTNNSGVTLPWADQTAFESAMAADNPSLSVSSYSLVGDELTVMGTGLVKIPDNECASIAEIIELESETITEVGDNSFAFCSITNCVLPELLIARISAFQSNPIVTGDFTKLVEVEENVFDGCTSLNLPFPALETTAFRSFAYTAYTEINLTNFPNVDYWGDQCLEGVETTNLVTNATIVRPDALTLCTKLVNVELNTATALFDIFGSNAYLDSKAVNNMTFSMPNLNNIINNPFADIISNGIIGGGTDFTITIPSAMGAATRITEAQSAGAIIVTV